MEIFGEFLVNQNSGETFSLQHGKENWIGRGIHDPLSEAEGRLMLAHPSISKMHAKIFLKPETNEWMLVDTSRHGVIVNDKKVIKELRLRHGDKIKIGPFTLMFYEKFKADDETSEQPLPTLTENLPRQQKTIIYVMATLIMEMILLIVWPPVLMALGFSMIFFAILLLAKTNWRNITKIPIRILLIILFLGIFGAGTALAKHLSLWRF